MVASCKEDTVKRAMQSVQGALPKQLIKSHMKMLTKLPREQKVLLVVSVRLQVSRESRWEARNFARAGAVGVGAPRFWRRRW